MAALVLLLAACQLARASHLADALAVSAVAGPALDTVCTPVCPKPWDMMEWKGESLWNRTQLAAAARITTAPQVWAALRQRLDAGHPLVFVAVGSSIIEGGGCFVSGEQAARDAGVHMLLRASMSGESWDDKRLDPAAPVGRCQGDGFLSLFMRAVNTTWPHAGHLLVNLGRGGVDLGYWANMCTHSMMPARVDMLLVESHDVTGRELQDTLPAVVGHVAATNPNVAVVVLSAPQIAPPRMVDSGVYPFSQDACVDGFGGYGMRCTWRGEARNRPGKFDYECSPQSIRGLSEWVHNDTAFDIIVTKQAPARGWTVISLRRAVVATYTPGNRLGWSECEYINAFYSDEIHFGTWLGRRGAADALIAHTLFSDEQVARPAFMPQPALAEKAKMCIDAEHFPVKRARGWSFLSDEPGAHHAIRKPGWVAMNVGDEAEVVFRMTVPVANVTIEYLTSYERMGAFGVACAASCTCARQEVDGHVHEHVSVMAMRAFEVRAGGECSIVFTVSERSSSGGHKVKILGLVVE
jgi:hypothetical protein